MECIAQPQKIKKFFFEEIILLGLVFSRHENEEDLIFRVARMLDWIYRRHTGQIGGFENETIEQMLKRPYQPHLSIIYLLEKHFPETERGRYESRKSLHHNARFLQQTKAWEVERTRSGALLKNLA